METKWRYCKHCKTRYKEKKDVCPNCNMDKDGNEDRERR